MDPLHLWLRHETRTTERRAPLTPWDAARLVESGARVSVEESPQRVFCCDDYRDAGCAIVPTGSWVDAPDDAYVLGIKELPPEPAELRHTHIFFGHAYKGQDGAAELLARFEAGGGTLLDLEYLTVEGRRVVAFGYWAGYVGAALGVLQVHGALESPLEPMERAALDAAVAKAGPVDALVIGALGRSGRGALDALEVAGSRATRWDVEETRSLDHDAIRAHELLVNCVLSAEPAPPFVGDEDLTAARRLRVVSDVTNDVTSANNLIPVNTSITSWEEPARRVADDPVLDVIAIDNLPSLLPREASAGFSEGLLPLLADLPARRGPWAAAQAVFERSL